MTWRRLEATVALACVVGCGGGSEGTATAPSDTSAGDPSSGAGTQDASASTTASSTDASTGTDSVTGADTSTGADTTTGEVMAAGCDGVSLRANPVDTAARGPWSVGARTVTIGELRTEVWYPAAPGTEAGAEQVVYDIRDSIPESEQGKISDEDNPWQPCECYRDLEVDAEYGPYPVVVFVHGTASFRSQSLPQMVHWASRGFVVVAADHPGLWLADLLGSFCGAGNVPQDLGGDVQTLLAAIRGEAPGLEFLGDRIDATRIGMAGHSAGGGAIAGFGDDAQVLIPLAAGGVDPGAALVSTLVMGGTADSVVAYDGQQNGFASSPAPKRLVGIENAGHLTFSQICSLANAAGEDLLEIASAAGVCGAQFAGVLFQCSPDLVADAVGWEIIDFATSAALEETLHCSSVGENFADLEASYPDVAEFQEE